MILSVEPESTLTLRVLLISFHPLTEKWVKKMLYIYTTEYYSAIKMNEIVPFAAT